MATEATETTARTKTYKRELAVIFSAFLMFLAYRSSLAEPLETLKVAIWPIMLYVGAAFGMDWAGKQTGLIRK